MLWGIWCRSGDAETDRLFRAGVDAMQQNRLADAEESICPRDRHDCRFRRRLEQARDGALYAKKFQRRRSPIASKLLRAIRIISARRQGKAFAIMTVNEFREAAVCFRRALEIHPHLDAVRHNLAVAEAEGGGSGYLH